MTGMGGYGGMGYGGMGYGGMGYGGMGYGGMGYGGYGMGYGAMGPAAYGAGYNGAPFAISPGANAQSLIAQQATGTPTGTDLTGRYLGSQPTPAGYISPDRIPHVIPNPFDNTLLVQGTPQDWEQIKNLLEQLDVPPRQVLIEAKIYEVDLTGAFQGGVEAYLQKVGQPLAGSGASGSGGTGSGSGSSSSSTGVPLSRQLLGTTAGGVLQLSAGMLVGHSRELLALLTAQEQTTRARVISAPTVVATDSIPAQIQVGESVPTLSSQAVAGGVQLGGNSLFTNTVSNQSTGVGLNIMARVNSSGIVTLMINQNVSSPQPTTTSSIQSPSFSQRMVQTQVTVQDGDTIAIGGIIQESDTLSSAGVPFLHRIPVVGMAFGSKSINKSRTELVVFLTPRVIYDTNQVVDASDELTSQLKRLQKMMKEQ